MPAIRPDAISDSIRLAYKLNAACRSLVAKRRTIDPLLGFPGAHVDALIADLPSSVDDLSATDRSQEQLSHLLEQLQPFESAFALLQAYHGAAE